MKTLLQQTEVTETIVNNEQRHFGDFPVGTVSHQGDVILVSIVGLPANAKVRQNRQVADGNTQGSRHILDGGDIYDGDTQNLIADATGQVIDRKYLGPVFRGGELTHPEHGNQSFPADCTIAVVYQRNLDAEEREQRVID